MHRCAFTCLNALHATCYVWVRDTLVLKVTWWLDNSITFLRSRTEVINLTDVPTAFPRPIVH